MGRDVPAVRETPVGWVRQQETWVASRLGDLPLVNSQQEVGVRRHTATKKLNVVINLHELKIRLVFSQASR